MPRVTQTSVSSSVKKASELDHFFLGSLVSLISDFSMPKYYASFTWDIEICEIFPGSADK